ncbi:MAG TPA: hypothetical protein VG270_01050 [Pseudolabrys sp.]|nr:hypothetical protein [Pseudolabrys sp.]
MTMLLAVSPHRGQSLSEIDPSKPRSVQPIDVSPLNNSRQASNRFCTAANVSIRGGERVHHSSRTCRPAGEPSTKTLSGRSPTSGSIVGDVL